MESIGIYSDTRRWRTVGRGERRDFAAGRWEVREFTEDGAFRRDPVPAGACWWIRVRWRRLKRLWWRDRKHLSEEGVVIPIIAIDKHTGRVESAPEIVTRGLMSETGTRCWRGRGMCGADGGESNLEERADWSVIKEKIRVDLKRYINKQTSKRPLILPVILEV